MWLVTLLVSLPAFLYGYVTAALNAAMITGDANSPSACFHNTDDDNPNCPPGTIYKDILLTTCGLHECTISHVTRLLKFDTKHAQYSKYNFLIFMM